MSNVRDLRFQRTNQLLIAAFTDLLSCKKFEDITVNELCEKALIRRATFYTHFLDKYDFFAYFIRQQSDSFSDRFSDAERDGDTNEFFLHMSRQLICYLNEHMTMVQNAMNSTAFPILLSILTEQIRQDLTEKFAAVRHDPSTGDASAEIVAAFYSGGLIQIVHSWISNKNRPSEDKLIEQIGLLLKFRPLTAADEFYKPTADCALLSEKLHHKTPITDNGVL